METRASRRNTLAREAPRSKSDASSSREVEDLSGVLTPPNEGLTTILRGQADILEALRTQSEDQRRVMALLEAMVLGRSAPQTAESQRTHSSAPPTHPTAPGASYEESPPRAEPELRVNAPEWDGSKDGLEDFLDQCDLNFEANPSKFPTDARRIMFAVGNMTGPPRVRIRNLRQQEAPPAWMSSWSSFCADLRRVYGDPDPSYTARLQLNSLRQRGPVSEHAAEFMSLAAKSNSTDQQQMLMLFEQSLKPRLREKLTNVPMDNMHDFINAAIRTEHRLQVIQEAGLPAGHPPNRTKAPTNPKREVVREGGRPPLPPKDPSRNVAEKLRQHRRANNQCYGCGGDHLVRDCPKASQTQTLRAHAVLLDESSGTILVNPMEEEELPPVPADLSSDSGDDDQGN